MGKPALLIIDMQNDFVLEGKPLKVTGARAVIPKIQTVLAEFGKGPCPVFHVLRVHRADGSDVEIIRQELFARSPFAVGGTKELQSLTNLRRKQVSMCSPRPA